MATLRHIQSISHTRSKTFFLFDWTAVFRFLHGFRWV